MLLKYKEMMKTTSIVVKYGHLEIKISFKISFDKLKNVKLILAVMLKR